MTERNYESAVAKCYSTWGDTYFKEYYMEGAPYPPVHTDLLIDGLKRAGARNVLDAGCGPASFLRSLKDAGMQPYGFDLTPEMVTEAKRVLGEQGFPADRVWTGSVLDAESFKPKAGAPLFDACVCVGVFPHLTEKDEDLAIRNIVAAVKPGGWVAIEARNQFFSLFTQNRYTHEFIFKELIRPDDLALEGKDTAFEHGRISREMEKHFAMELPPKRLGKRDEPGYDEVLSRTHNPLVLKDKVAAAGTTQTELKFYHYHCVPPMLSGADPVAFKKLSLSQENPDDWRGLFMASAFFVVARKA